MGLFPKRRPDAPPPEQPKRPQPEPPPSQPGGPKTPDPDDPLSKAAPPSPRRFLPPSGRPPAEEPARQEPAAPTDPPKRHDLDKKPAAPPPAVPRPTASPRPSQPTRQQAGGDLEVLLTEAVRRGASDLHLTRHVPPILRVDGRLISMEGWSPMAAPDLERLVLGMLTKEQRERFEKEWELDVSLEFSQVGRFRVNVHKQRGTPEAAFRIVNDTIKPLRQLGLPSVVEELARKRSGLMVVTGPTGSGKTTTMAAIVDQINHERDAMIVTVEDPIEYVHKNRRSVVKQREITSDTHSFVHALRHVLRQDPDVIVIGEMRDLETIQTSLIAAETGHMVFSTLHTPDAVQTIDRIIDVFPPHHQDQVRIQLAGTLQAVLAQQLIPMPGNQGRAVATEILIANSAVRKTIRTGKTEQLMTVIQTGFEQGMVSMDKSLKNLYLQGMITFDEAISRCKFPESFEQI